MLDHTGIFVPHDLHAKAVAWNEAALKPLGNKKFITEGPNDAIVGFSDTGEHADWWIVAADKTSEPKMHHAFTAKGVSPEADGGRRASRWEAMLMLTVNGRPCHR